MSGSGPLWLADFFATAMIVVAVYSAAHLTVARYWSRRTHVDVDLMHIAMGVAMAGMLVSSLNPIPSGVWEVVFAALGAWFVGRCYSFIAKRGVTGRDQDHIHHLSHYTTHLVMSMAMLYMYLAAVSPAAAAKDASMAITMAMPTGINADFVGLPLFFLLVLLASGVWELDGVQRFAEARSMQAALVPALVGTGPSAVGSLADANDKQAGWLTPGLESGAHIAMCITMSYMLILML
jgi:hypothetical protein